MDYETDAPARKRPIPYKAYPRCLFHHATKTSRTVISEADEKSWTAQGWTREPFIETFPEPATGGGLSEAMDPISLTNRIRAVESEIAGLKDQIAQLRQSSGRRRE